MKIRTKNLLVVFSLLVASAAASWFAHDHWERVQSRKAVWDATVRDFNNCSVATAIRRMGYITGAEEVDRFLGAAVDVASQLPEFLTGGYRDGTIKGLQDVWIDPAVEDSLSNKATPSSLQLSAMCDAKIKDGDLGIGLDIAYFYLYLGHPASQEILDNLAAQGVTDALVLLGHAYRQGLLGAVKDEKLAFAYYLKAAMKGSPKGMLNVAHLLQSVDPEKANRYVLAAAERGSLTAIYQLQNARTNLSMSVFFPLSEEEKKKAQAGYFWSLVFSALQASARNELLTENGAYVRPINRSGLLSEHGRGLAFDGVPAQSWAGYPWPEVAAQSMVTFFDSEEVKQRQSRIEAALDSDTRIAVQERAKRWATSFSEKAKAGSSTPPLPESGDVPMVHPRVKTDRISI